MIPPDLYICDKRNVIFKDERYWCLAENPAKCPFAFHLNYSAYECNHPEHLNFFKNKPTANPS